MSVIHANIKHSSNFTPLRSIHTNEHQETADTTFKIFVSKFIEETELMFNPPSSTEVKGTYILTVEHHSIEVTFGNGSPVLLTRGLNDDQEVKLRESLNYKAQQ